MKACSQQNAGLAVTSKIPRIEDQFDEQAAFAAASNTVLSAADMVFFLPPPFRGIIVF